MDPEREPLPAELEALFADARAAQPTPEMLDSVRSGLGDKLDAPLPSTTPALPLKPIVGAVAVCVALGGALWFGSAHRAGPGAAEPHAAPAPALPAQNMAVPRAPEDAADDAVTGSEPLPPAPTLTPAIPNDTSASSRARRASPARPTETELLDRAQAALRTSPAEALRLTRRHARLYPDGVLIQEREALAIRALVRGHHTDRARRRLQAFARRWPASAHIHGLEQLVSAATPAAD